MTTQAVPRQAPHLAVPSSGTALGPASATDVLAGEPSRAPHGAQQRRIQAPGLRRASFRPTARAPARRKPVTILLPAKDEEAGIGRTLESLPLETMRTMGFEPHILVLDGRSRDATARIARKWGATVIADPEPGKGAAFRHARRHMRGEFVLMLDADGTYAADALPVALARLAWDQADVVMGIRRVQPGAMSGLHRVGNAALSAGASLLYGRWCPDVCTGLWGFRTDVLRRLPLQSQGFELEAELFALACRTRQRVSRVTVDYMPRAKAGRAKLSTARDGWRIGWWLLRARFARLASAPGSLPAQAKLPAEAIPAEAAP